MTTQEYTVLERARVWNQGEQEHVESFNGKEIRIPAKGHIEMEYKEGEAFKSQFFPLVKNTATGRETQNKPIRVEKFLVKILKSEAAHSNALDTVFRCMACPKARDFQSQAEYDEHVAEKHLHVMLDKTAKEKLEKK